MTIDKTAKSYTSRLRGQLGEVAGIQVTNRRNIHNFAIIVAHKYTYTHTNKYILNTTEATQRHLGISKLPFYHHYAPYPPSPFSSSHVSLGIVVGKQAFLRLRY